MAKWHNCRHANIALVLGAWLGHDMYIVMELLPTDLYTALADPHIAASLRWDDRYVVQLPNHLARSLLDNYMITDMPADICHASVTAMITGARALLTTLLLGWHTCIPKTLYIWTSGRLVQPVWAQQAKPCPVAA